MVLFILIHKTLPQQLPVALYKVFLISLAVVIGYWVDRALYPYALPTPSTQRLHFAHSDWSGYSVFEEAFTRGLWAGMIATA